MALKQAIEIADLLDNPTVTGRQVGELLARRGGADWDTRLSTARKDLPTSFGSPLPAGRGNGPEVSSRRSESSVGWEG